MPYLAPELLDILCDYLSKSDLLGFARVNKLFSAVARRRLHRLVPLRLSFGYKRPEPPNSPITTEAWETIRGVEIKLNMTRGSRCTYPTKWSVVSLAPVWGFNGTSPIRGSCHIILNIQDWSHKYLGSGAVTLLSPARFQVPRDNVTSSALIGLTSFEKLVVTIERENEDIKYIKRFARDEWCVVQQILEPTLGPGVRLDQGEFYDHCGLRGRPVRLTSTPSRYQQEEMFDNVYSVRVTDVECLGRIAGEGDWATLKWKRR